MGFSQELPSNIVLKEFVVKNDSITLSKVSISPFYFKIYDKDKKEISKENYAIDFPKAILYLLNDTYLNKTIFVAYEKLPDFLTKTYQTLNENLIVDNVNNQTNLYQPATQKDTKKPFEGLDTNGNISRGITMGNNQDGVLNSNFDLELAGNLSSKVKLKAHITDNHIPLNNGGYTQRLNEFDKVFIEMYSKDWRVTAGDIYFNESDNYYLNFNKKVSGLSVDVHLGNEEKKLDLFTSGALVKGKFSQVDFNGIESNQGPYRLAAVNEPFLLIIANSETVYINGIPLERGKEHDYSIDYNTSEITFNTTHPINATMRIHVEFQASDENFTRFVTFNKADYKNEKLKLQVGFYNENDVKSQTLQQDLNDEQLQILANAGDNISQMNALSAIREEYVENKIQYKKEFQNGVETFVFSSNETDELYAVRFSYLGANNGNYKIINTIATGRIYEYIAPIGLIKQGDYEPTIQLIAPNKSQIATLKASFTPNDNTQIATEMAFSDTDKNLFSSLDDDNNQGFAGKINWKQVLIDKDWKLSSDVHLETIQNSFNTIENINNVEFNRDWNLVNPTGNQQTLSIGLNYSNKEKGFASYQFNRLGFGSFNGFKHLVNSNLNLNSIKINSSMSLLSSKSTLEESDFTTFYTKATKEFKQFLIGAKVHFENNIRTNNSTQQLSALSHKNVQYDTYFTVGDSAKANIELGYSFRENDSVQLASLQNVNKSNSFYVKSKLIQNKTSNLAIYLNFRKRTNKFFTDDKSLNSRFNYRQQLLGNLVTFNTVYETNSGVLPQQEFNYMQVDPGNGFYTWIDYNTNGIQDLDEFEIAQFSDQATYVRVLLPTTRFIRTNLTAFNQVIDLNFSQWKNKKGVKKFASHFSNRASLQIENKQLKTTTFHLNPFDIDGALALQYSLKNSLYLNRGKQWFSANYNYFKNENKTAFITGLQAHEMITNQVLFYHKIKSQWLLSLQGNISDTRSNNENYANRNFDLHSNELKGKIAYLLAKIATLDLHYRYQDKNNKLAGLEDLQANSFGVALKYSKSKKMSIHTGFDFIQNDYNGNPYSPVAFQILEGLQNGKNYTWNVLFQKKITNYMDLNLNYNARKSPNFKTIHTGTVQLRANF